MPPHDPPGINQAPKLTAGPLRWASILLPALFVVGVEVVLYFGLEPWLGDASAHLIAAGLMVAAIVPFSLAVFRVIDAKEQTIVAQAWQARLAAERLGRLIESSGDAIITVDLSGRIATWNSGAEAIYGWSREEAIGALLPMVPADLLDDARRIMAKLQADGEVIANYETERLRKDGRRIPVVVTVSSIRNAQGLMTSMLGISKDMSDHRQLEDQQRRLALLEDRERIGMELHDGAIQSLYAVGLGLEATAQVLPTNPGLALERLGQARDNVNGVIREIRNYILGLRPDAFANAGLVPGLRELAQELQANTLIDVEVDVHPGIERMLGAEAAEAAYQIAHEALSNVARHAHATHATLRLRPSGRQLSLEVIDNGVGFDVSHPPGAGFGLGNMKARAQRLGTELEVVSRPGEGSAVHMLIPAREMELVGAAAHS